MKRTAIGVILFAAAFFISSLIPVEAQAVTQYITFRQGVTRTVKEPSQHSRFGGSAHLGSIGDTLGLPTLGLGIALDTFWAPGGGNQQTDINMQFDWDFTTDELNSYNVGFAGKYLSPRVPLGSLKISTKEFYYRRQIGFSTKVAIDVNYKGKWYNNIVGVNIADLGINIDDSANEKIGPGTGAGGSPGVYGSDAYYHSDTVMVSDLPGLANGFATNIIKLLQKAGVKALSGYGAAVTKSLAETALEKIAGFSLGVQVTQRTFKRSMEFDLSVSAKDMDGNPVTVVLDTNHLIVNDESSDFIIYGKFPENCKPLKEVKLYVGNAVYHYSDQGNVEIGLRTSFISLTTDAVTQDLFDPNNYNVNGSSGVEFYVKSDPLLFVPFHGAVVTGEPECGLAGAEVTMKVEGITQSVLTGPDGKFYGDFYIPAKGGMTKVSNPKVTAHKEGFKQYENRQGQPSVTNLPDGSIKVGMSADDPNNSLYISGKVLSVQGQPIADAEVSLAGEITQWVTTNAAGEFLFPSVIRSQTLDLGAYKTGYYIPHKTITTQNGVREYSTDLQSNIAQLVGSIKIQLTKPQGTSFPAFVGLTLEDGRSFAQGIQSDGMAGVSVYEAGHKTVTLSLDGYTFTPSQVSADFTGAGGETKNFTVAIAPTAPSSITLVPSRTTIAGGGIYFNPPRPEETVTLTATVKDSAGRTSPGVNVRFDLVSADKVGAPEFSSSDPAFGSGRGYAVTDASGVAKIDVWSANTTLGGASLKFNARAFRLAQGQGSSESNVISPDVTISVTPSTRAANPNKPTASVTVSATKKAVVSAAKPTVETGGEVTFHLAATPGNPQGVPLVPAGTIIGYKLGISKDNGQWQDTEYPGFPSASIPQTFDQKGQYKVSFMALESCGTVDVWSDRAVAEFIVAEYTPPTVVLDIPNTNGAVNLPLYYSFNTTANGSTLKTIQLVFGDNKMDFNIDSGILSGKTNWPGNYHHIYDAAGTYTITLTATDQNNRSTQTSQTVTIGSIASMNDTTAPTGSIALSNGATTTNDLTVAVHITASDNAGGVGISGYRFSNDGTTWGIWYSVSIDDIPVPSIDKNTAWTLSNAPGQKTVYAQVKDAANNISQTMTDTIMYANTISLAAATGDGSSPGIYSGSNKPEYTWDQSTPTGSISVSSVNNGIAVVVMSMSDMGTAPGNRMCLSANGTNWTAWELFSPSKDFIVQPLQTKIYVKYADGVGNISQAYSADLPQGQVGGGQVVAQVQDQAGGGQVAGQLPGGGPGGVVEPGNALGGPILGGAGIGAGEQIGEQIQQGDAIDGNTSMDDKRTRRDKILDEKKKIEDRRQGSLSGTQAVGSRSLVTRPGFNAKKLKDMGESSQASGGETVSGPSTVATGDISQQGAGTGTTGTATLPPAADISVEDIRVRKELPLDKAAEIEAAIKNNSALNAEGCAVSFEADDGAKDKKVISLRKNQRERVTFSWTPKSAGKHSIKVSADLKDDPKPSNNSRSETVEVKRPEPVNIALIDMKPGSEFIVGKRADVEVNLKNESDIDIKNCRVFMETEDGFRADEKISLSPKARERVKFTWTPKREGRQEINFRLECAEDTNPRDNKLSEKVNVIGPRGGELPRPGQGLVRGIKDRTNRSGVSERLMQSTEELKDNNAQR